MDFTRQVDRDSIERYQDIFSQDYKQREMNCQVIESCIGWILSIL